MEEELWVQSDKLRMAGKNRTVHGWRAGAERRARCRQSSAKLRRLLIGCVGTAGPEECGSSSRQTLYRATRSLCQRAKTNGPEEENRIVAESQRACSIGGLVGRGYIGLALAPFDVERYCVTTD